MFIHVRNDELDIDRQLKCVILRTNILMRTFSSCSVEVKLFLFQSYCSNFYCSHLWYNFTKVQMNKLRITYNNAIGLSGSLRSLHPQRVWRPERRQYVFVFRGDVYVACTSQCRLRSLRENPLWSIESRQPHSQLQWRFRDKSLWGGCLIYILYAVLVKCLQTATFILWMRWEGHVYIVLFNGWNVLARQSSHVLCHPLSYRNVPYGIIGLNVYIYICRPFLQHLYVFLIL